MLTKKKIINKEMKNRKYEEGVYQIYSLEYNQSTMLWIKCKIVTTSHFLIYIYIYAYDNSGRDERNFISWMLTTLY